MLFEDETVHGVIKKALGKKPLSGFGKPRGGFGKGPASQNKPMRASRGRSETFNNLAFGSRISGTGRRGFGSARSAAEAAGREMERLARRHYPDRFDAIMAGQRHSAIMIPELAAAIEVRETSGRSRTSLYPSIHAGRRQPNGSGEFEVPYTSELAAVVHAHWVENSRSSDDERQRFSTLRHARSDQERTLILPDEIEFYVYSPRTGLRRY